MIQHEIDHLDGVLILDRISREARKEAMRAMREAQETRERGLAAAASRALSTVFLGTSEFAAAILERLAARAAASPGARAHPPRPPARARTALASPPVAERARALGLALEQPDERQRSRRPSRGSPRPSRTPSSSARSAR